MAVKTFFKVKDIDPNPYRGLDEDHYPYDAETLAKLEESMREHGWIGGSLEGRRNGNGRPQIVAGHHRLESARRVLGQDFAIEVSLRDLDDDTMVKHMDGENLSTGAGRMATVAIGTIREVVKGFARGELHLPTTPASARGVQDSQLRQAPSFKMGSWPPGGQDRKLTYTAATIARYLGPAWQAAGAKGADPRGSIQLKNTLSALELIEEGFLSDRDFEGVETTEIEAALGAGREARRAHATRAREAEVAKKAAERREATAKVEAEKAKVARAKAEKDAKAAATKAAERKARELAEAEKRKQERHEAAARAERQRVKDELDAEKRARQESARAAANATGASLGEKRRRSHNKKREHKTPTTPPPTTVKTTAENKAEEERLLKSLAQARREREHPSTPEGSAARKATGLLRKGLATLGTPESEGFLTKVNQLIDAHGLNAIVTVRDDV